MVKFKKVLLCGLVVFVLMNLLAVSVFASDNAVGKVTASVLNLRSGPGLSFEIIGSIPKGDTIEVITNYREWYRVITEDGEAGWVNSQYVTFQKAVPSRGETDRPSIVEYAERFLGTQYVWGGNNPDGFDCSGFVKYVFHKFGHELKRVASDQASQGTWVDKSDLIPGDLVFFDTDGGHNYINHAGMYIGDGKFIHASSAAGKVTISNLSKGFYSNSYMTAKRILD